MHTSHSDFHSVQVDTAASVIRGVSIISKGVARGHDLVVDDVTLSQMQACAEAKGQVPVKIDHKSGAGAVCGFLVNFRQENGKLKADWHLLESHPQKAQILEVARRMPRGVGLSAAFQGPDKPETLPNGKNAARCVDLISIDYVSLPAANPDGLFAAKSERRERKEPLDSVARIANAGRIGAEAGAVLAGSAFVGKRLLKSRRIPKLSPGFKKGVASAATKGAVAGGLIAGAYRIGRDRMERERQFERETIANILFAEKPAIRRVTDAASSEVAKNIDIPGAAEIQAATQAAKNRRVRSIIWRGAKIASAATLGHVAGKKLGARAGLIGGAVAGAFLERNFQTMNDNNTHRRLTQLVERESAPIRVGKSETHTLPTLARRLLCTEGQAQQLLASGVLVPIGPVHRGREDGPISYNSDDLNDVKKAILHAVVDRVIESADGDPDSMVTAAGQALRKHRLDHEKPAPGAAKAKEFSRRLSANGTFTLAQPEEENRPGFIRRAVGTAAVAGGLYAGASAVRGARPGSSLVDAIRRGNRANVGDLRRAASVVRPGLSAATQKVLKVAGYRPI